MMRTLVMGLPGTGKSSYVRGHLGNGLAYDLDAIAAAFRLRNPHEEQNEASRQMANDFLSGFLSKVEDYTDSVFIIRTAPRLEELYDIQPDSIVVCTKQYVNRGHNININQFINRLGDVETYANSHGKKITYIPEYPDYLKQDEASTTPKGNHKKDYCHSDHSNKKFYNSAKWIHLRDVALRRDGYICQISKQYGKTIQAETVHHIFPLSEYPEYGLELWNLVSVTHVRHMELHVLSGALSPAGIALLIKTARKNDIAIPSKYL